MFLIFNHQAPVARGLGIAAALKVLEITDKCYSGGFGKR